MAREGPGMHRMNRVVIARQQVETCPGGVAHIRQQVQRTVLLVWYPRGDVTEDEEAVARQQCACQIPEQDRIVVRSGGESPRRGRSEVPKVRVRCKPVRHSFHGTCPTDALHWVGKLSGVTRRAISPGGKTVDLPIAEAVETSGAYASNALFIAGSVLSSPVGLIGDLGSFLSSFLPRF